MRWNEINTVECSIARALSVVGDRWTMMIVRDVFLGIRRFDAMQKDLDLTPHRLSHRLGKLVRDGILARVEYEKAPAPVRVSADRKGHRSLSAHRRAEHLGRSLDGGPLGRAD